MTKWEKKFNKLVGVTRFKVERTFGGIKRWFAGGVARYRGIKKMHTQNLMEAICYNLEQIKIIDRQYESFATVLIYLSLNDKYTNEGIFQFNVGFALHF